MSLSNNSTTYRSKENITVNNITINFLSFNKISFGKLPELLTSVSSTVNSTSQHLWREIKPYINDPIVDALLMQSILEKTDLYIRYHQLIC